LVHTRKNKHPERENHKYEKNPLPHLLLSQNAIRTLCTRKASDVGMCEMSVPAVVRTAIDTTFRGGNGCFADKLTIAFDATEQLSTHANDRTLDVWTRSNHANDLVGKGVHVCLRSQPVGFGDGALEVGTG